MSTCWSMWTARCVSDQRSIGPTSAATVTASPSPKSAARSQPATSPRPRRRRRDVGERELHRLELRDRLAELVPLLRVGEREVVRALREPDAHRRHRDAAAVEDLQELPEALAALTEQVPLRHGAVVEGELARVRRAPPELVQRRRDLVSPRPV